MRCNHTHGMPRGDFNIYFASSRRGEHVRAEEAVGIVLLVVIIAALLILGCWYFKKRSGYKIIRTPRSGSPGFTGGQFSEAGPSADNKMALTNFGSFQPPVRDPIVFHHISLSATKTVFCLRKKIKTLEGLVSAYLFESSLLYLIYPSQ
ncbi:melanoma antigen recognized by T-cells 1 [Xyrichtys novacula]|uniref:Melanoma antigen recognized by T-cells 1 n=1 Tax=Xyrichtys novacula TaxID=13765 RepID=A0AAV1G9T3_XYRNO|nr:melanoma antigen recognized by T-cells 1 [Xyrichtys novacula]